MKMKQTTDIIIYEYAGVVRFDRMFSSYNPDMIMRFTKDEYLSLADIKYINKIELYKYNFATISARDFLNEINNGNCILEVELHVDGEVEPLDFPLKPVFILGYNMSLLHLAADEFDLERGRMFENDSEAVITRELNPYPYRWDENMSEWVESLTWNSLDLGDMLVIQSDDGLYKEFTVVGIQAENPADPPNTNRRMIFTAFEGAEYFESIAEESMTSVAITPMMNMDATRVEYQDFVNMGYDVLIYLNSPDDFKHLQTEMYEKGVLIAPLFPNFNSIMSLTTVIQAWAMVFMIITGFIITTVTIITTIILLSTRKYEIAVLRSVGMRKRRIIGNI